MARLAHGGALLLAALTLLALAAPAGANTITTIAGGGSVTPGTYGVSSPFIDPVTLSLPSPGAVAWSGDPKGMMYVVSSQTCAIYWYDPDPASPDYGFYREGGTSGECNPTGAGYPSLVDANSVKLANPCCVTSDQRFDRSDSSNTATGPYVASTGSGRVERYSWFYNQGQTLAGGSQDCSTNPPPTSGDPATKQFCTITALARDFNSPYDYAFGESGRGTSPGNIYWVHNNSIVSEYGVPSTPYSLAAFTFNWNGALINSNGLGILFAYACCPVGLPIAFAGSTQTGYKDAAHATDARFDGAKGVTVAFDKSIYVADSNNCRIRRIVGMFSTAAVTTVAGNACDSSAPPGDGGPASAASFDHPTGVAFAPTGLVISDTGHNRLRLIDRTSIVDAPSATADSTPSFDIRSLDIPSHLKCTLDGADVNCTNLGTVADGHHTLTAWENGDATSPPDPPDPTPAVHNFAVDTGAPTGVALRSPDSGATGVPGNPGFSWDAGTDAVTGIDHYELRIDGAKNRDVATSACSAGVCVAQAAQPLTEGEHSWQVAAIDAVGNTASTETRTLQTGGPPNAAFTISPNPALAGRTVTFDGSTSADESGIARYEWDLDGDGAFETDAGANPATSRVYQAPTTLTVHLRVTDGLGKQSTAEQQLRVTVPTSGQSLLGVSINNGAQFTRSPDVTLTVKPPATSNAFIVSNDGGFFTPTTFPAAPTVKWRLDSSGPERLPKTVYLRFMLGPIISTNYTDDIILDEVPPVVQQAALVPPPRPGTAASAARLKGYKLKVKAKDSNSGVAKLQVTANKKKPGKLLAYKTTLSVKLASKPKFLRARDKAGNFSAWKKLR
jgi:hypothetical protein